jgi:uncharacterized membrane protein
VGRYIDKLAFCSFILKDNFMKYRLLMLLGMVISNPLIASTYNGVITGIGVGPHYDASCSGATSCAVIMVDSSHTKAECNSNSWSFAFDASTDTGKNILSLALAAEMSKQIVVIGGTGLCTIQGSIEDLKYLYHKNW